MLKKKNRITIKYFIIHPKKYPGKKASQHKANLVIKFVNIRVNLILNVKSSEMQGLENRMEKHRKALGTFAHNL